MNFPSIPVFLVPLVVGFLIQMLKLIIDALNDKKLSISYAWRAWWFPSVHSAICSSISILMWLTYGFGSELFAVCIVFSLLFWYDAMNVRYEAWVHAQAINMIRDELWWPDEDNDGEVDILTERLWHTLLEVLGWIIFGAVLTWVYYFYIWV